MEWEVWEVGARPPRADQTRTTPSAADGERWLCFASATDRRRLASYPRRWQAMSPRELDALCRAANPARGQAPGSSAAGAVQRPAQAAEAAEAPRPSLRRQPE